ncbi:MAG TPA: hypothetical protein VLA89_04515 [Gemmatimonadales bacterium]|nr:hypothetical protein [Gemmatimonadales bacterium]
MDYMLLTHVSQELDGDALLGIVFIVFAVIALVAWLCDDVKLR